MLKCDFNKVALQSNFTEITLWWHGCSPVNCIFSEYPFLRAPLDDCLKFWEIHKKASMMEFNFSKLVDYN